MIKKLKFVFFYALRNMIRDRRRTAFTRLCVAAGVATVVALRALGLMLTDALTANAQAFLRGDLRVGSFNGDEISIFNLGEADHAFGSDDIADLEVWAAEHNVEITFMLNSELMQTAVVRDERAGAPALAMSTFIEPDIYPFYDVIRAEEPAGATLGELLTGPNQVVIAQRLAGQLDAVVGDRVRIGSAENLFTVSGIVPDVAESTFESPSNFLFSFVYMNRDEQPQFDLDNFADRAYIKTPPDANQQQLIRDLERWPSSNSGRGRTGWYVRSATEVLEENEMIADVISRFVLVLSLVGLVIGGVGIINTMLVAVNRRSAEIAILKTLGLQGQDISLVFMAEAIIAGFVGSLLGVVFGVLLSYIARNMGEQAFALPLPWRVYFDPMVIGVALGMTITIFFSFLPTIMATRIRPNLVLREGSIPLVKAGWLATLLTLVLLVVGLGLLVDIIIGSQRFDLPLPAPLTPGIAGTLAVFILLAVILGLMWLLVWVLGKIPSFRSPNLRIAIRGLATHRSRTALSLLALVIGMTALSGTLIMARSINMLLYTSISQPMGGNVIIISLPLVKSTVHSRLEGLSGINGYRDIRFPEDSRLVAIDGQSNYRSWFNEEEDAQAALRGATLEMLIGVDVYGDSTRNRLEEGRYLGPEDAGQYRITIPYISELAAHDVGVGSELTYNIGNRRRDFEVVGVVSQGTDTGLIPFSLSDTAIQIPLDLVESEMPFDFIVVDVDPESIRDMMASVGTIPGLFVFDISIFDSMISRLMNQFAALPILVAGLSLFAASALIATTVALATMERRHQIATLKAIGVSRWETLGQLLAENGIIGIAGGVVSLLPTALILTLVPSLTEGIVRLPAPVDLMLLMLALSVVITMTATLITAWSASGEKPLVALRYE